MIRPYRLRKLLAPTTGLYRALGVTALGLLAFAIGAGLSYRKLIVPVLEWSMRITRQGLAQFVPASEVDLAAHYLALPFLVAGLFLTYRGLREAFSHVLETLSPGLKADKFDIYKRRQQLAQGPRIVAIGGGTGLSTLLRGLKQHSSNITAIVCVSDDGGSSGKLTREKGMIPPGDIRNCLVALADAEKSMTDLFQYRFRNDSGSLSGHSMGNLLIAALVDQAHQDFEKAVETASDVLAIRGRVVPATLDRVSLRAIVAGGIEVCGETAIVEAHRKIERIMLDPADCKPTKEALDAIQQADLICVGPGSVFTSLIPNLLVPGIAKALKEAKAPKVYVCNVMTQPGESDDFSASEHVGAILSQVEGRIFDYVMVNNAIPSADALEKYRGSGANVVEPDLDRIRTQGLRVIPGNFISETDVVRHDPMKVASRLMRLINY